MSKETQGTEKLILCPYCGHAQYGGDRCQSCKGLFEPLSRRATQLAMGPWQIRDKNQPFRPGCCYDVLKTMAKSGAIKSTTIMRGPTTRQFWSIARNVPGVAHLVGYCHKCGSHVSPNDTKCGKCGALFEEPRDRNVLGLAYTTDEEAKRAQKKLNAEIQGQTTSEKTPKPAKNAQPQPASTTDLLSEVLDLSGDLGDTLGAKPTQAAPTEISTAAPASPTANGQTSTPASVFDIEPTRELPASEGISTLGLVLVGLNIAAIAAIIVLWLMLR